MAAVTGNKINRDGKYVHPALSNPAVVADYLLKEDQAGCLVGPLIKSPAVTPQVSPFGVIPQGSQPGKWRLIVYLSSTHGSSVNYGIDESLCSLSYMSVEEVASKILELGAGSEMAKLNIKSAYRIVPVHLDDGSSQGWSGRVSSI